MHRLVAAASLVAIASLAGCVERRVFIESEPSGALVWMNDAQVGRTPVDVAILHHGEYDIRIEKAGYETLVTSARTTPAGWDFVPADFFVEVSPGVSRSETRWRFALVVRNDSEEALLKRAESMRQGAAEAARATE